MWNRLALFIALICFGACSRNAGITSKQYILQPLGNFPEVEYYSVKEKLRLVLPNLKLAAAKEFPANAYNKTRDRYRADTLIHELQKGFDKQTKVIGLCSKDISTTKGTHSDWGIMGLAYMPGTSCVVSTYRLSKTNKVDQLYKLILHELAHTEGLPHCNHEKCIMQDAEGKNKFDGLTDFCNTCKDKLTKVGWQLD